MLQDKYRFIIFSLLYLVIIVLVIPEVIPWWYQVSYWLFAVFLLWIARFCDKGEEGSKKEYKRLFWATLILLLITRIRV